MRNSKALVVILAISTSIFAVNIKSNAADSASLKTASTVVLATCGHNNASFLFDSAAQVPVGCQVSTINQPPAAAIK